jgi:hypothetical protein
MGNDVEKEIFELVCYLVTSARNLVRETKMYGPFRLIDACGRLIEILEQMGAGSEFLVGVKAQIEENKYKVISDEEAFVDFLDNLVLELVGQLKEGT